MPQSRSKPGVKLAIVCPQLCSYHPEKIGAENANVLKVIRENGAGAPTLARRAEELLGHPVSIASVNRHLKHYRELVPDEPDPAADGPRPTDLAILDSIIHSGFRNSKHWRPTIKDTIDAMKLKIAMTGQSAFEDMLRAMESGLDLADGELDMEENPDAVASEDERVPDIAYLTDQSGDG
jgi:hypothetical protein